MVAFASLFALGWFFYTFIEYAVHRFGGHSRLWKRGNRDHLIHHSNPRYFPGTHLVLGLAFVPIAALLFAFLPASAATGFLAGALVGLGLFEYVHRTLHNSHRPPRTVYGRWIARNHLHHHFVKANTNHGITSPLWDILFGTYEAVGTVVVRGHTRTIPPWLADAPAGDGRILLAERSDGSRSADAAL